MTWSAGASPCASITGRWTGAGTATSPSCSRISLGAEAEKLIPRIEKAVKAYDYAQAGDYRIWPGPNSNSFIAAVLRTVPELGVALPPNAVGRDFRYGFYAGRTDSGTGLEINLHGYAGIKVGWIEGIETECLGPGRRSRSASSRPEAARLRPHRH